ncbi:MAG: phytanoyl-CoA dioxygenase family protein [Chloroflexota bacterium]
MQRFLVSETERSQKALATEKVEQAVQAIHEDGYLVLENIISHDHLDILREKMTEDSHTLINADKWGGAGRLPGHLQQGPPPFAPYVFPDIVANPFITQVTKGVLGAGMFNSFYSGNTNCPGSNEQPLHSDQQHLWPNLPVAHPAASLVVNIALRDVTIADGAIELWPGSHLETRTTGRIDADIAAERREVNPPIRGETKKGDVLIRDMRVWHRGVPNQSDELRHMIALVHNISWRERKQILKFNKGCEAAFEGVSMDQNVEFVDEEIDYLFQPFIGP